VRHVVSWLGWWVFGFVLWLLYAGTIARLELLAGAAAAAVGATAAELVRSQGVLRFALPGRRLLRVWRIPGDLLREYAIVLGALARALLRGKRTPGRFQENPYDAGPTTTLAGAGWRALATVGGTISPNTIVIDVDPERDVILVHDLVPDKAKPEPL
jgi:hypothetical protein